MRPGLTDEKLKVIIKLALEFNASIIAQVSFIHGCSLKERDLKRAYKEMQNTFKRYGEDIETAVNGNPR